MEREEQTQGFGSGLRGVLVFLGGLALVVGLNFLCGFAGYREGMRVAQDQPGGAGLVALALAAILLLPLRMIGARWGRRPIGFPLAALLVLLPVQLFFLYHAGYVYGDATSRSKRALDYSALFQVGDALERYRRERGAYPATLEALTPGYLRQVPASQFDARMRMQAVFANDRVTSGVAPFVLWLPGPDRVDDLQAGPELEADLKVSTTAAPSAWLINRTYDPSNGGTSPGDIRRLGLHSTP